MMSLETRTGTLGGDIVLLRIIVTDDMGNLRDTDDLPEVFIYDESLDVDDIESQVSETDYSNAVAGPLTASRISLGFYELEYQVPSGAGEGFWRDVWVGELDAVGVYSIQQFRVISGANIGLQHLGHNQLLIVTLGSEIASLDGTANLGESVQVSLATTYNPYYASVDLVRMEGGPLLDYIPDDTLALMIHWASREVDFIAQPKKKLPEFKFARTKFVIFDAALRALTLPGGLFVNPLLGSDGERKTLGHLSIAKGRGRLSSFQTGIGGADIETLKYFRNLRDEWWRVVNAGGTIVPGEGLGPSIALQGRYNPDRNIPGRGWESPSDFLYEQPGSNARVRRVGHFRTKSGFLTRGSRSGRGIRRV